MLVGTALRGRGERDYFFNNLKMVGDDPALHRYVEQGYSVVVSGTAYVGYILIGIGRLYSVSRSGSSGLE